MFLAPGQVNIDIWSTKPNGTGLGHVTTVLEDAFEMATPFD